MFLGGGGGASTYASAQTAAAGGQGGGIIIILSETLKGKGKMIIADGDTPVGMPSANAGAGGGGGGGSIALYQQSFSTPADTAKLYIYARGGKGGSTTNIFGEGGGGGGGLILTNNTPDPGAGIVTRAVTGGAAGTRPSFTASPGSPGSDLTTFAPTLNGFLFQFNKIICDRQSC